MKSAIYEYEKLTFVLNSSSARFIRFSCFGLDGISPRPGLTFSGSDLKTSKNMLTFGDFSGSVVTDYGDGNYVYRAGDAEIDTAPTRFTLRLNRSDLYPGIFVATLSAGSVPVVPGSGGQAGGFGFSEWFRF